MKYDVIGDVHGNVDKLGALLRKLGYGVKQGVWRHPDSDRLAIFVGDFVDRGPSQIATYNLVRKMIDRGYAMAVMGNHELNAVAYCTKGANGEYLRDHAPHHKRQHQAFLEELSSDPALYAEIIDWMLELPLWLDLPEIRVVHACWDDVAIQQLGPLLRPGFRMPRELIEQATTGESNSYGFDGTPPEGNPIFWSVETILKGVEIDLPEGRSYRDKDGTERSEARMKWWEKSPGTFAERAIVDPAHRELLPHEEVPPGILKGYASEKPLFLGHYWMSGTPACLSPNVACVDYSAGKGGPLVAYRWSGEATLRNENFVQS